MDVAPPRAMLSAPSCAIPTPWPHPRPVSVISGEAVAFGAAQSTTARAASNLRKNPDYPTIAAGVPR